MTKLSFYLFSLFFSMHFPNYFKVLIRISTDVSVFLVFLLVFGHLTLVTSDRSCVNVPSCE